MKKKLFTAPYFVAIGVICLLSILPASTAEGIADGVKKYLGTSAAFIVLFTLVWMGMKKLVVPLFDDMSSPEENKRQRGWKMAAAAWDLGFGEAGIRKNNKGYTLDKDETVEDGRRK